MYWGSQPDLQLRLSQSCGAQGYDKIDLIEHETGKIMEPMRHN